MNSIPESPFHEYLDTLTFDASYLMVENRLPFHYTTESRQAWVEQHGTHHRLHIGLYGESGFSLQIINGENKSEADFSTTYGVRTTAANDNPHFRNGLTSLAAEVRKHLKI